MRLGLLPVWALAASTASILGCGSSPGDNGPADSGAASTSDAGGTIADAGTVTVAHDAAPQDAGPPPEILADAGDYGSVSSTYPAFTVDAPQILNGGQASLSAPIIVTITWPGDALVDTFEAFGDNIGASSYWKSATAEYGVGPATSGPTNHVHLTQAVPASITPEDIASLVTTNVQNAASDAGAGDDAGPAWPAPTPQTIYAVYLPQGAQFTEQGVDICAQGVGGYHDNVTVNGNPVAYAVMPHCNDTTTTPPVVFTDVDIEESASHEFAEAATDPYPDPQANGWVGFDQNHWNYEYFNAMQDELGDACESFLSSFYQDSETAFPYWVQRIWSNKGAAAGHNPCTPTLATPYYNLTLFPDQEQDITLSLQTAGYPDQKTKGFHAVVGQSVTFQVGFFSDADTGGPWTVTAEVDTDLPFPDQNYNPITNGAATVTIDQPTGQNGQKAYVTITPTTAGQIGSQLIVLKSALPGDASAEHPDHYLPIIVSTQ